MDAFFSKKSTICTCKPNSSSHINGVDIFRSKQMLKQSSYLFKIESYSLLMNQKYESNDFEAGGYKWKLVLHPAGDNSKTNDKDYVSLYLKLVDTEVFKKGWRSISTNFKMFVRDQKHDNFLTIQDAGDFTERSFTKDNIEWGFEKLISLKDLKHKSNGYLVNDSCEFGVEVFVFAIGGGPDLSEVLSMIKNPATDTTRWRFEKFSTLGNTSYQSNTQLVGDRDWILWIYPKGHTPETKGYLSLFLELKKCEANKTVYATYTIKILDQIHKKHHQKTESSWFHSSPDVAAGNWLKDKVMYNIPGAVSNLLGSSSSMLGSLSNIDKPNNAKGFSKFISLSELNKGKGYIKNNDIIVEVSIQVSMTKVVGKKERNSLFGL